MVQVNGIWRLLTQRLSKDFVDRVKYSTLWQSDACSSLPRGILGTAVLIGLSACKAVLVVLFYMHLKDDSRLFAVALALPLFIALVSSIFLLTVPIKGC